MHLVSKSAYLRKTWSTTHRIIRKSVHDKGKRLTYPGYKGKFVLSFLGQESFDAVVGTRRSSYIRSVIIAYVNLWRLS
jgi:hypothetical protein